MILYDGNSSKANILLDSNQQIPENISSCGNEIYVSFYSSQWGGQNMGYRAKIHVTDDLGQPGTTDYCTSDCPCIADEGHCESNDQCMSGHYCGFNNCRPELGFANGTNCCYSATDYCSEFLSTDGNGTWILQTPVNNTNKYVVGLTCTWYIDVVSNSHGSGPTGSTTCGAALSDWSCCTDSDPCVAGDGECDSDSECVNGLICGNDNCGPLFPWGFDCCKPAVAVESNIVANFALEVLEVSNIEYFGRQVRSFVLIHNAFRCGLVS